MPKQFLDSDKNKWLELYDSGKTEKWIAREYAKCDPRTVKRGIEEARRRQDARIARAEILKEALRKHHDSLLGELDQMLSSLAVPADDFVPLSWLHDGQSVLTQPQAVTEHQTVDVPKSHRVSRDREQTVRRLLRQHLKNDRLWKALAEWEKAYAAHITARIALQRRTVDILEEKTGYELVDRDGVSPPFVCSYTTGDLFFKAALRKGFGTPKSIDLESDTVANTATGDVRYRGSILAVAPGHEKSTRRNLVNALRTLEESPEVNQVLSTYGALEEITERTRQVVEHLKLLGLIPGQCEICQRLGM